jgi:hypothetical protein
MPKDLPGVLRPSRELGRSGFQLAAKEFELAFFASLQNRRAKQVMVENVEQLILPPKGPVAAQALLRKRMPRATIRRWGTTMLNATASLMSTTVVSVQENSPDVPDVWLHRRGLPPVHRKDRRAVSLGGA